MTPQFTKKAERQKTRCLVCEFPEATPSNNRVMRMHWRARQKENNRVYLEMRHILGAACWFKPFDQCTLTITRYGSRALDDDNLAGGFKFLIDALVKNNIIADDNPGCIIGKDYRQEKCARKNERTLIEVEEIT